MPVYRALRDRLDAEKEIYVLADTTYGSYALTPSIPLRGKKADHSCFGDGSRCCVDEVAAQHVDADLIIHYGHACLSPFVVLFRSSLANSPLNCFNMR